MSRDSTLEGFRETGIGYLPNNWSVQRIEEIVAEGKGSIRMGPFGSQLRKADLASSGFRVYGQENVISDDFSLGTRFVDSEKFESLSGFEVKPGDTLVTMMGTVGRAAVVPQGIQRGIIDSHLLRIRVRTDLMHPQFFKYLFTSRTLKRQVGQQGHGVIMKGLNTSIMKSLLVPVPPLDEQLRISAALSSAKSVISKTEATISALKELKRSMMKHLFTYGLTSASEAGKVNTRETDLGFVPDEWRMIKLKNLADTGKIVLTNGFGCGRWNSEGRGIVHVRPFNVTSDGAIDLSTLKFCEEDVDLEKYQLRKGDVVFNNTNSEELVGKTALWDREGPYAPSNHMTIIRVVDSGLVSSEFLAHYLHSRWIQGEFSKIARRHVNQAGISLQRLMSVEIPVPPLSIQEGIADALGGISNSLTIGQQCLAARNALFATLLERLMSGNVRLECMPDEARTTQTIEIKYINHQRPAPSESPRRQPG